MLRAPPTRRARRTIGVAVPRVRARAHTIDAIGTRALAPRLRGCAVRAARMPSPEGG
jgi:hypothetical protein